MKNNNQHLAETHEEDFLNDLLIQAGFNPEEDNFEEEILRNKVKFVRLIRRLEHGQHNFYAQVIL